MPSITYVSMIQSNKIISLEKFFQSGTLLRYFVLISIFLIFLILVYFGNRAFEKILLLTGLSFGLLISRLTSIHKLGINPEYVFFFLIIITFGPIATLAISAFLTLVHLYAALNDTVFDIFILKDVTIGIRGFIQYTIQVAIFVLLFSQINVVSLLSNLSKYYLITLVVYLIIDALFARFTAPVPLALILFGFTLAFVFHWILIIHVGQFIFGHFSEIFLLLRNPI